MKYLFLLIPLISFGQVTRPDTVFISHPLPFVSDTFRINVKTNDEVTSISQYNIGCVRYAAGTTWRTIKNFGKIRLTTTGHLTFVTTKPTTLTPITEFNYTGVSPCGTSQNKVYIRDSVLYYCSDTSKAYSMIALENGRTLYGYYVEDNGTYYIQYPGFRKLCTREEYLFAMANRR